MRGRSSTRASPSRSASRGNRTRRSWSRPRPSRSCRVRDSHHRIVRRPPPAHSRSSVTASVSGIQMSAGRVRAAGEAVGAAPRLHFPRWRRGSLRPRGFRDSSSRMRFVATMRISRRSAMARSGRPRRRKVSRPGWPGNGVSRARRLACTLSSTTRPPCSSMIFFTIASPGPVPSLWSSRTVECVCSTSSAKRARVGESERRLAAVFADNAIAKCGSATSAAHRPRSRGDCGTPGAGGWARPAR